MGIPDARTMNVPSIFLSEIFRGAGEEALATSDRVAVRESRALDDYLFLKRLRVRGSRDHRKTRSQGPGFSMVQHS